MNRTIHCSGPNAITLRVLEAPRDPPRSESEVTGAAFVSEKRSEHRRTALKGANFGCVEAGFLDGSQG